jgi:methanogenic corrinoid protein MtbC1
LNQKREAANTLITDLVNNQKIPIDEIYYYIFERSQKEVGAMWERDEISVGDEHYISAFTQMIIASLFPKVFQTEITKEKVVLMAVENEFHELGIRMIADLFSLDGWDAHYFGGDVPIDDILAVIKKNEPYIVVISATFSKNIVYVKRLIENLKREAIDTRVFVGGYAFNRYSELAIKIGADYYTKDSKEIINIANKILKNEKNKKSS